jgi:hypothetical protein
VRGHPQEMTIHLLKKPQENPCDFKSQYFKLERGRGKKKSKHKKDEFHEFLIQEKPKNLVTLNPI